MPHEENDTWYLKCYKAKKYTSFTCMSYIQQQQQKNTYMTFTTTTTNWQKEEKKYHIQKYMFHQKKIKRKKSYIGIELKEKTKRKNIFDFC